MSDNLIRMDTNQGLFIVCTKSKEICILVLLTLFVIILSVKLGSSVTYVLKELLV